MNLVRTMTSDEIQKRLNVVRLEHSELNQKVDELAHRNIITPEEEVELKKLRKLKLRKKDMISYLSRLVEDV